MHSMRWMRMHRYFSTLFLFAHRTYIAVESSLDLPSLQHVPPPLERSAFTYPSRLGLPDRLHTHTHSPVLSSSLPPLFPLLPFHCFRPSLGIEGTYTRNTHRIHVHLHVHLDVWWAMLSLELHIEYGMSQALNNCITK